MKMLRHDNYYLRFISLEIYYYIQLVYNREDKLLEETFHVEKIKGTHKILSIIGITTDIGNTKLLLCCTTDL